MAHHPEHRAGMVLFEQKGEEGERLHKAPTPQELAAGLTYFGNRLCPFAHRAWWAMHEKDVVQEFKYVHVDLGEDKPAWFKEAVNPFGTVPCVYDHGHGVFESAIIVEFLEDKFPGRGQALMPSDAVARAAVRLFVSQLSFAPLYAFLVEQDRAKDGEHLAACNMALEALEARYAAQHGTGPFFLGDALSAADVALLTFIDRFVSGLQAHRGYHIFEQAVPLPRLAAAHAAVKKRAAWCATALPPAIYVSAYEGYAAGKRGVPRYVKAVTPDAAAYPAVPPAPPPPP